MKQITMDWETYQKEIAESKDRYDEGFESGAQACQNRLDPILNYLREIIHSTEPMTNLIKQNLKDLMKEASEI